jgi:hypothetical protein
LSSAATAGYGSGVPNAPKTPARQMRISDEDWGDLEAAAKIFDKERAAVVRDFIHWYLRRPGAKAPDRPSPEQVAEIVRKRKSQ